MRTRDSFNQCQNSILKFFCVRYLFRHVASPQARNLTRISQNPYYVLFPAQVSLFVEQNERLLDQRNGDFGGGQKKDGERGNYRGGDRNGGERGGYRGGRGGYRGGQSRSYGQNQNASAAASTSRQ